jgi:hypothetical protein
LIIYKDIYVSQNDLKSPAIPIKNWAKELLAISIVINKITYKHILYKQLRLTGGDQISYIEFHFKGFIYGHYLKSLLIKCPSKIANSHFKKDWAFILVFRPVKLQNGILMAILKSWSPIANGPIESRQAVEKENFNFLPGNNLHECIYENC